MLFNVALLQIRPHQLNIQENLQTGEMFCRKAKELCAEIDLIVFPEMWSIGYTAFDECVWLPDFIPHKAEKNLPNKIDDWKNFAIAIDSSFIQHYRRLAEEIDVAITVTFLEKGEHKPYNSVVVIDRKGNIILHYRKVHTCDFSLEYFCEAGEEFYVCELETKNDLIKLGAMICYDREFPEAARALMLKGAEIIIVPNSCTMDSHRNAQLQTRSFENMVGVALANYPAPKCNGSSQAYSPVAYTKEGKLVDNLIAKAESDETILIASFNMNEIRDYRQRETWGNAYRKVNAYTAITEKKTDSPFFREDAKK